MTERKGELQDAGLKKVQRSSLRWLHAERGGTFEWRKGGRAIDLI